MGGCRGVRRVCLPDLDKQLLHRDFDTSNLCSSFFPIPPARRRRASRSAASPRARLAEEHGTPLLVYCEATIRAQARAYREAAPGRAVVYGTKAFANVALLRVLAEEGVGADVSTLGELAFAQAAGSRATGILFHGNNKSDEELRAAAEAGATVVLDAPDEPARAARGRRAARARPADAGRRGGHARSIRTAHDDSKFGLPPEAALRASTRRAALGLEVAGVHFHVGSQLARVDESLARGRAARRVLRARTRDELGWTPQSLDIGGGLGIRYTRDDAGARDRRLRRPARRAAARALARPGAARARARPLARRPRRRDALPRRRRQGERRRHATPRSTAACPTTRGRSSTARATRRCSRTAPTSSPTASSASPESTASPATC